MKKQNKFINKLINEKSPYLLQHAHNPVDWYPWNEEAFTRAKLENKPIFLSIGYSTCHWCHVMEKESFEDENVANILNKYFISIKVDREERPDIDMIYMNFCMMLTGSGGWPLTIFMTPDKKPFYAGTYFPKENKYGRIGLIELLLKIVNLWKNDHKSIIDSSEQIFNLLNQSTTKQVKKENLNPQILKEAYHTFKNRYDSINGGFGKSPKFPTPHNYIFLLRYYHHTGDKLALQMVEHSATKMRLGGIFDQIGYGFHRYSTDENWLVPHFEKMLYDQALMAYMYIELYQLTKNNFYKNVVEEIFEYVLRDMTGEDGGFFSAEDADSEGKEGKFYLWKYEELKSILGNEANIFIDVFNVTENGNFHSELHSHGENILYLKKTLHEIASEKKITESKIEKIRKILFDYRKKRIPPLKDDKILTDWNGLMIAAMAYAAQVFKSEKYLQTASNATKFILDNMIKEHGCLYHRYRDKDISFEGNLDDYAFLIWGLLELYQSSFEVKYLKEAITLQDTQIKKFWDDTDGGFFFTEKKQTEDLIQRPKVCHDSAIPSGNSISLNNLLKLYYITGNTVYLEYSHKLIKYCAGEVNSSPYYYTMLLSAYLYLNSPSQEIVIVGNKNEAEAIINIINQKYNPYRIIILKSEDEGFDEIAPFTTEMKKIQNKPTVYICENFTCKLPVNTIEEVEKII